MIAVDFDNTIYDFHMSQLNLKPVIELVKRAHGLGLTIFCFTANIDHDLVRHVWDRDLDIQDIAINENRLDNLFDSRKPFYSLLLDDRAGLKSAMQDLEKVCEYIENLQFSA